VIIALSSKKKSRGTHLGNIGRPAGGSGVLLPTTPSGPKGKRIRGNGGVTAGHSARLREKQSGLSGERAPTWPQQMIPISAGLAERSRLYAWLGGGSTFYVAWFSRRALSRLELLQDGLSSIEDCLTGVSENWMPAAWHSGHLKFHLDDFRND